MNPFHKIINDIKKNIIVFMLDDSFLFKIALLGDGAVGKTSLRKRFMGEGFEQTYSLTIGSDFSTAHKLVDGSNVVFQIWDLSGQPNFKLVRTSFYLGTHAAIVVFDLSNRKTFFELENWISELFQYGTRGKIPLIIVGNKSDLVSQISTEEIDHFITSHPEFSENLEKLYYLETSALTGENVHLAFEQLGRFCIKMYG